MYNADASFAATRPRVVVDMLSLLAAALSWRPGDTALLEGLALDDAEAASVRLGAGASLALGGNRPTFPPGPRTIASI